MKLNQLVQNKFFKILKYFLAFILLLSAILGLLSTWYADGAVFDKTQYQIVFNKQSLKTACLVLSFMSIIVTVWALSSSKNLIMVLVLTILMFILIIAILSMASIITVNVDLIKIL